MEALTRRTLARRLFRYSGLRGAAFELIVAGLLLNILGLALPLTLLQMYDRIIPNDAFSTLGVLILGVVIAAVLESLLRVLRSQVTGWLGTRFEHVVSVDGLKHLMEVPLRTFLAAETRSYGEQLRAVGQIRDFYSGQALLVLIDLPFAFVYIAVIAFIGGWLGAVALGMIILFLAITAAFSAKLRDTIETRTTQDERRYNFLAETFRGIHSVKTMAMEPLMHRRYEKLQEANVEQSAKVADAGANSSGLGVLFTQLMTIGIVAAGAYLVIQNELTPGGLAACVMLSVRALQPLRRSLQMWIRFQSFAVAQERLKRLFALPTLAIDEGTRRMPEVLGELELSDVTVQFPGKPEPVFENLNLKIAAGECIAILGESGSGKSTLMAVLNGTMEADGGEALVDGVPIRDIYPEDLQSQIAYLPQHGTLVSGTILDNVTMHEYQFTEPALKACQAIGLDKVVKSMRLGYETPVGEGTAETMPAGIRQRIAIAREIIHQPKVILFDEANIAMDGEGDTALKNYLESLKGKATIVLVAHRPSLLRMADRVFEIKDRGLVETTLDAHYAAEREQTQVIKERTDRPEGDLWRVQDSVRHFPEPSGLSLCLPALITSLKWHGSPRKLAESLPHLVDSLDLSGFRSIMASTGFDSKSYRTRFKGIDRRLLPCLFVPDDGAAKVVLDWSPEDGFRVFDSETVSVESGKTYDEDGEAFLFNYDFDAEGRAETAQTGWTRSILTRLKMFAFLTLAVTVLSKVLALATPLFVMGTFDFVIPTRDYLTEVFLIGGVGTVLFIDFLLRRLKSQIMAFMAGRSEFIIGNSIFQRILGLPTMAIEKVAVSEQVARVKDLEALREFFIGPLAMLAYEFPAIVVFVVVLAILNPWMLVVVLVLAIAYMILGALTFQPQAKRTMQATRLISKRDAFLEETLVNMLTLRAAGATETWEDRFREISGAAAMAEFRSLQFNERVSVTAQFFAMMGGISAMAVASIGAMAGDITGGAVIASMIIIWRLTTPMQNAFMSAATIVRVLNSARQIDNLMQLAVEQDTSLRQSIQTTVTGAVDFSRVSFRYSMNADPALLGISFDVEPGEMVAIAGPNGSGKSTLLKLLVRAFQPQAGNIRIDGVDVRQMSPARLRDLVSYMPQRCEIFYGTIAQNLRLVHPTATEEEMRWAAEEADILEDIDALEQGQGNWKRVGFETRLSDSQADQMPNGFRQRLGLARAFLKPAPLMLLDEPGNGLDPRGDQALVKALEHLHGKSTVFIVSHRPSHLKLADKVIYIEQGSIRAVGPFDNDNVRQIVMAGLG